MTAYAPDEPSTGRSYAWCDKPPAGTRKPSPKHADEVDAAWVLDFLGQPGCNKPCCGRLLGFKIGAGGFRLVTVGRP